MPLNVTDAGLKVAAVSMASLNAISLFLLAIIFSDITALETKFTAQAQYNVETYARRDDVELDVDRILAAIKDLSDKLDKNKHEP
jgi:hypothetical protein